jgi:glutathione S-transferase
MASGPVFENGLQVLNKGLEHHDYLVSGFSMADAALFSVEFWADAQQDHAPAKLRRTLRPNESEAVNSEGVSRRGTLVGRYSPRGAKSCSSEHRA